MKRLIEENPRLLYVMRAALVTTGVDSASLIVMEADNRHGQVLMLHPFVPWNAANIHGPMVSILQGQQKEEVRGSGMPVLTPYSKQPIKLTHALAINVMDGLILWVDKREGHFEAGPMDMLNAVAELCRDHLTSTIKLKQAKRRIQASGNTIETVTRLSDTKTDAQSMSEEVVKFAHRIEPGVRAAFFALIDEQDKGFAWITAAKAPKKEKFLGKRFTLADSLVGLALNAETEIPNNGKYRKGMNRVFGHDLPNPVSSEEGLLVVPAMTHRNPKGALVVIGEDLSDTYTRFYLRNAVQVMANRILALEQLGEVTEKALFDPLTGLYTRKAMNVRLVEVLASAKRYKRPTSVLMLDIDHFKRVNDTYGHQVGDKVLLYVAQQVVGNLRDSDMAARYGGEEFLVILPETKKDEAAVIAERIRASLDNALVPVGTHALHVTISIGVSLCVSGECTVQELIGGADRNLYRAKESGRNQVVL